MKKGNFINKCKGITTVLVLMGMIFSAWFFIDSRYALSETVKQISERLDYKIITDQVFSVEERMFRIEIEYGDYNKMPALSKEEYNKLKSKRALLLEKLDKLEKYHDE